MNIESRLSKILGTTYGGPSLSYENKKWHIYVWYDAPTCENVLGSGATIKEAIDNYEKTIKLREKLKKRTKKSK